MKTKKIALCLAFAACVSAVGGCAEKQEEGKINLSVGVWPDETNPELLESQNKIKDEFMEKNQDINILTDTYKYDQATFMMKATADQLPNMYKPWFTEIKQIIKAGHAADITDAMKKYGLDTALNPDLIEMVTDENGRIYGIPTDVYAQGLYINKEIFKQAGLVNEDGSIKIPESWQDVAEFSQTIKEKTGKAGFIMPTTNNVGGWQFLNIAWGYGVEFEQQREDGTWEAIFDNQKTRDALQYVKDLKWKYDALLDDTVIDQDDIYKYFGSSQAAMMIADPPKSMYSQGMSPDVMLLTNIPAGPEGRYAQMGGNLWMFSRNSTPEQIDAGFRWLDFTGFSAKLNDEQIKNIRSGFEQTIANHGIVLDREAFDVWVDPERVATTEAIRKEYTNIDPKDYESYYAFEGVTIKAEPPACAQQLYAIMDKCIQEVITNENADIDELITIACKDLQVNHLDKM